MAALATGCESSGTTSGDDCTSHYDKVADAPTRAALLSALREEVDPRVRDLRVVEDHARAGTVTVNLLDRRDRTVMSLDMWQLDDDSWTARQWSQCTD